MLISLGAVSRCLIAIDIEPGLSIESQVGSALEQQEQETTFPSGNAEERLRRGPVRGNGKREHIGSRVGGIDFSRFAVIH